MVIETQTLLFMIQIVTEDIPNGDLGRRALSRVVKEPRPERARVTTRPKKETA